MFSTPLIDCSSGEATASAMTSGFAPGYVALTTTVGGTTSGYSLMGRFGSAITPAMRMIDDSTPAKMGREMKNCASFKAQYSKGCDSMGKAYRRIASVGSRRFARGAVRFNGGDLTQAISVHVHDHFGRGNQCAGPHSLQTVDDDDLANPKSAVDHPESINVGSQGHTAVVDRAVALEYEHELLAEIGADRAVVDEDGVAGIAPYQPDAYEQPRCVDSVRICEYRSRADGSCLAVDLVVDKIQTAAMWEILLVGQTHIDGVLARSAVCGIPAVAQEGLLIGIETRIDRVVRDDCGEQAVAGYQIALRNQGTGYAPVNRCANFGKLEIQLGGVERGVRRGQIAGGDGVGTREALEFLARDGVFTNQALRAGVIGLGQIQFR